MGGGVCFLTICPKMHQKRVEGVLKNGKGHKIGYKLRYMTSINIVSLQKKFSLMSWSPLVAFCPQYIDEFIQSVFLPYRVSKKMKNPMKLAKT